MFDLTGRHALITAAGTPLADGLALALAEAGANVSLLNDGSAAARTAAAAALDRCQQTGSRGIHLSVPPTDPTRVADAVGQIEEAIAPLDILVNAILPGMVKPFAETTIDDWQSGLQTATLATFATTHAAGAGMRERGYGRIINLVSVLADRAMPNVSLIAAAEGAVLSFTRALGIEWAGYGIAINALCIGFVDGLPGPHADPDVANALARYAPVKRLGTVDDLAGAVIFLASEQAGYIVSETFLADGGLSTHA